MKKLILILLAFFAIFTYIRVFERAEAQTTEGISAEVSSEISGEISVEIVR